MTTSTTPLAENKSFSAPDETRTFERGHLDLVEIAGSEIGRLTLEPGWRWSEHVKPIAGTELCEAPHFQYHVSGRLWLRSPGRGYGFPIHHSMRDLLVGDDKKMFG